MSRSKTEGKDGLFSDLIKDEGDFLLGRQTCCTFYKMLANLACTENLEKRHNETLSANKSTVCSIQAFHKSAHE